MNNAGAYRKSRVRKSRPEEVDFVMREKMNGEKYYGEAGIMNNEW